MAGVHAHLGVPTPASVQTHTHGSETYTHPVRGYMYSEPCTQLPKHHTHCHVLRSTHSQAEGSDSSCTPISWRQQLGFSELPFHVCQLDIPSLTSVCPHEYTHAMDTGTRSWFPMCKYRYARCHQASKVCRILAISLNPPGLEKREWVCKHVIKHITHPWTWGPGWGPGGDSQTRPPWWEE